MKTLLAVSGGIDSMCMADMFSRAGESFAIAHCNFHLRGEESDADAELVENWARSHGAPFHRADFDTKAYAVEKGISIEMAARELRYAWFAKLAIGGGFDAVATAHNANDNAETLILNLLRGTGSRGLRGISPVGEILRNTGSSTAVRLIRPLLGMTRKDIEEYAQKYEVPFREDRTNAESIYKRNRIRNVIFPEFEKINPSFVQTLNADMERFSQVDDIAEDYFREAEQKVRRGEDILVTELLSFKHWKYILFRLLEPCSFSAGTFADITALLSQMAENEDIAFSGKRFLSPTHIAETASGRIAVRRIADRRPGDACLIVNGPGIYDLDGVRVRVEEIDFKPGTELKQPAGVLLCDADALGLPFLLRHWMAGDWMRPFGMEGRAKKVSDIFTDLKMSRLDKEAAVVAVSPSLNSDGDGHIAALVGHRMDEALRITEGSKKTVRISTIE